MKEKEIFSLLSEKNKDFSKRIERLGHDAQYIKGDDTLLVTIGKPKISAGIDLDENITVFYNPTTYKVTGFTVLCFREWYLKRNQKVNTHKINIKSAVNGFISNFGIGQSNQQLAF